MGWASCLPGNIDHRQDAGSTVAILITGKMPVPPRCLFYKTLQIIPVFVSNAIKCDRLQILNTPNHFL
ncbi:MAG: hypothetical protein F6K26_44705 [Moorea sp. SIO2I5]|nr:hypothetical protein [Moorena sp. SIO2I5]